MAGFGSLANRYLRGGVDILSSACTPKYGPRDDCNARSVAALPLSPMNNAPPYRAIVAATGTLVVGWALGYLMGGPSELSNVAFAQATATGDRGAVGVTRREVVERFSSSNDPGFVSISDSSLGANGNLTAQFDTLVRGALRITDA